jgi:hypothetical protein
LSNSHARSLARLRTEEAPELVGEAGRVDTGGGGNAAEVQGAHAHSMVATACLRETRGGEAARAGGTGDGPSTAAVLRWPTAWASVREGWREARRRWW